MAESWLWESPPEHRWPRWDPSGRGSLDRAHWGASIGHGVCRGLRMCWESPVNKSNPPRFNYLRFYCTLRRRGQGPPPPTLWRLWGCSRHRPSIPPWADTAARGLPGSSALTSSWDFSFPKRVQFPLLCVACAGQVHRHPWHVLCPSLGVRSATGLTYAHHVTWKLEASEDGAGPGEHRDAKEGPKLQDRKEHVLAQLSVALTRNLCSQRPEHLSCRAGWARGCGLSAPCSGPARPVEEGSGETVGSQECLNTCRADSGCSGPPAWLVEQRWATLAKQHGCNYLGLRKMSEQV